MFLYKACILYVIFITAMFLIVVFVLCCENVTNVELVATQISVQTDNKALSYLVLSVLTVSTTYIIIK